MATAEQAGGAVSQVLRAGRASVQVALPSLRGLSWSDTELVQSVQVTVRDRNWGTVPGKVTGLESSVFGESARLAFSCTHDDGDIGFVWVGEVTVAVTRQGACVIGYTIQGQAIRDFRANRIGFCVLHPLSVAGRAVSIRSPEGSSTGHFPARISAHQPFLDVVGMNYKLGGAEVNIYFEGAVYETEDQRNWTDASFKTYSPPLHIPFPRSFRKGEQLRQRVVVEVSGPSTRVGRPSGGHAVASVRLGGLISAEVPAIGVGLGPMEPEDDGVIEEALARLAPAHLHGVVEPGRSGWERQLRSAGLVALRTGIPIQYEIVVSEPDELEVVAQTMREGQGHPIRVMLFDRATSVTTRVLVSTWQGLAHSYGLTGTVFGGSRANFAELNRNEPPYEFLSGLTFCINPQVHAFGDDDVVETLPVQEVVTRQAKSMSPALDVHVGPVTLKPRFNAVATDPTVDLEPTEDPRQCSWWTAGWTLGSVAALARGGAAAVTYFETIGPNGVACSCPSPSGHSLSTYPVFEVLRKLGRLKGARLVATETGNQRSPAVLAVAERGRLHVFAANLVGEANSFKLSGNASRLSREPLAAGAPGLPDSGRPAAERRYLAGEEIELSPYEVAVLSGPLSSE